MTKIKFTGIVAGLSGALSGTTFLKSKSGSFAAQKNNGTTTNSAIANIHKNKFQELQRLYKTLSDEQRLTWSVLASQYPSEKSLIGTHYMNGFLLFMELNGNRITTDQAPLLTAPFLETVGLPDSAVLSIDFSTPVLSVEFSPSPVPVGKYLLLFATKYKYPGVSNFDYKYKFIKALPAGTVSPVVITSEYLATLPRPLDGSIVVLKALYQSEATGQRVQGTLNEPSVVVPPFPFTGIQLWVESTEFTIAGAISQWTDLSGNNNHLLQASSFDKPKVVLNQKNGKPAILFETSDFMTPTVPIAANGDWEQLIVGKKLLDDRAGMGLSHVSNELPYPFLQLGTNVIYVQTLTQGGYVNDTVFVQWNYFNSYSEGNVPNLIRNGVAETLTLYGISGTYAPLNRFGKLGGISSFNHVLMCMFWNRVLTPSERSQVNAYVQSIYGTFP